MVAKPAPIPLDCNPLCAKCRRTCRQPAGALLVDCPRFLPYPFKIAKHRYEQIDLFGDES
ncbi:MAG: hypothetical protein A2091_01845 [Desulfuromonadales bacterium GWD2_61_12]|nr:MAG: hypothetical protein A2005_06030 [Desulfuromonadales bacterium GWC2_61_20]OGR35723.1 MAG: hypothetical protein A2091_01845 [Desulfuromonadales bacterium GWD2_61_12]HAD04408.1 hypothetical protein [Desulfuromonas sp.]HBT82954.1 hypothetical protein [Desulfuromonas sp.]